MARRKIPEERKAAYYLGMVLAGVGVLIFFSVFVTGFANFGDFSDFQGQSKSGMGRAIAGLAMIAVGQFLMKLGRSGLAGSGVTLDPEKARTDLEPWSRMQGGRMSDALDEAGIVLGENQGKQSLPFDEKLRRLEKLKEDGLVTSSEYEEVREKILENLS